MKKSEKVHIPSATDKAAAVEYNEIVDLINNDKDRMWELSDGTATVDLMGIKHHILKKIEHLEEEERERILAKHKYFQSLKNRMAPIKRRVYGSGEKGVLVLEARKSELLEWFGMYYTPEEIHKKLVEESGITMNVSAIRRFQNKYRLEIEKLQSEYDKNYDTVGVAKKRSRLGTLDYMLMKTKQEFDKAVGTKMLPYSREMVKILDQARKEVEGEQVHMTLDGKIDITTSIEMSKSTEDIYSSINFMTLLIARVAARLQVSPMMIQHQLSNSWYSRFSGVKRNKSLMDEEPDYPSKIILNWDDLKDKVYKKEKENKALMDKFEIEDAKILPATEAKVSNIQKDKLKELLKKKQMEVGGAKKRLRGES